ncbi:MAG TPA: aldo/keto reductase [Gemmatimonadales bacterium]
MDSSRISQGPAAAAGTITLGDGLTVNRMGFGAMRLTGRGIWGPPADRAESVRVLRRAVELGVDFIDTADSYGPNVSEEIIAEALHPYPEGLVIATKGGLERPGPDQWTPNGRPEYLRRQLEGSLSRLRLERIDLWQLHRIDPQVPAEEQFEALREFQREGLIRLVGLSEVPVSDIARARQVLEIVSVQNRYNITDREWEDELEYCEREEIAFLPWFPLSAGALEEGGALDRIARRLGATVYQVALAWLLHRSPAMLVIPGTSSVDHLEENVAAAEITLSAEDMRELEPASRG